MTQSLYPWDYKLWLWNNASLSLDFIQGRFLYDRDDQFNEN